MNDDKMNRELFDNVASELVSNFGVEFWVDIGDLLFKKFGHLKELEWRRMCNWVIDNCNIKPRLAKFFVAVNVLNISIEGVSSQEEMKQEEFLRRSQQIDQETGWLNRARRELLSRTQEELVEVAKEVDRRMEYFHFLPEKTKQEQRQRQMEIVYAEKFFGATGMTAHEVFSGPTDKHCKRDSVQTESKVKDIKSASELIYDDIPF